MNRHLRNRLDRLENAQRQVGVRVEVVVDKADAARVHQEHRAAGDPRRLITVLTGVPRAEGP